MILITGVDISSRSAAMSGCAEKQATRKPSYCAAMGRRACRQRAVERMASLLLSMAVGPVEGAVKPVTVTVGGRVGPREERQAWVMEGVELGLMRRTLRVLEEVPVMEGREAIVVCGEDFFNAFVWGEVHTAM